MVSIPPIGRVLIVPSVPDDARRCLSEAGYQLEHTTEVHEASPGPDAIVLSVESQDPSEDVRRVRAQWPLVGLVAIVRGEAPGLEAMTAGADRAVDEAEPPERLLVALRRAIETARLRARVAAEPNPATPAEYPGLVGQHPSMQGLLRKVSQVAPRRATVLLLGESGSGKEVVARAIHAASPRAANPFVAVNCAALSETLLESELFGHDKGAFTGAAESRIGRFAKANGGTLFLDEISEVPLSLQVKLLRFLQEREYEPVGSDKTIKVDVRIIAATNRDLKLRVEEGLFREDLYYRLNVVQLDIPPLRARPSDVLLLADHFLRSIAEEEGVPVEGLTEDARRALLVYPWPGNVRELRNAIERAVVMVEGAWIGPDDLPFAATETHAAEDAVRLMVPGVTLAELERYAILRTLESVGGSTQRAAEILGISRRKVQYRLKEWGVMGAEPPPDP